MVEVTRFKSRNMSASVEFMLFFFTLIRPSLGCEQITPLNSLPIRFIGEIRLGVSAIEKLACGEPALAGAAPGVRVLW